jgi:hypothetical protein
MAGVTFPQPARRQNVHAEQSYAVFRRRNAADDFTGAIAGAIVHDNDLEQDSLLREQAPQSLLDSRLLIAGRDDDGAAKRIAHRLGLNVSCGRQTPHPAQMPERREHPKHKERSHSVEEQ